MAEAFPIQEALPDDDRHRRVVWAGLLTPHQQGGWRVSVWLEQLDDAGAVLTEELLQIRISVGGVSLFAIGSVWKGNTRIAHSGTAEEIQIADVRSVEIVRAGDIWESFSNGKRRQLPYISKFDLSLNFEQSDGVRIRGFNAWLVLLTDTRNRRILIPCYELFRAFYGSSSTLANMILAHPWNKLVDRFILDAREVLKEGKTEWEIDLSDGIARGALNTLCFLAFVPSADKAADLFHAGFTATTAWSRDAWMRCGLPVTQGCLGLWAETREIPHSEAILVQRIRHFLPEIPAAIRATYDQTVRFVVDPNRDPIVVDEDEPDPVETTPGSVSGSGTRRNTKRHHKLGGDPASFPKWPVPVVTPRAIKVVSVPPGEGPKPKKVPVPVGTGNAVSGKGLPARAEVTGQPAAERASRFSAFIAAVKTYVNADESRRSYRILPLVRGRPDGTCAFNNLTSKWSSVHGRNRGLLVIALSSAGESIYLLEIEPDSSGRKYRAVVFTVLDRSKLTAVQLSQIMDTLEFNKGVWKDGLASKVPKLRLVALKHSSDANGNIAHSIFTRAFKALC